MIMFNTFNNIEIVVTKKYESTFTFISPNEDSLSLALSNYYAHFFRIFSIKLLALLSDNIVVINIRENNHRD